MPTSPEQTTGDLDYRLVRGSYRLLGADRRGCRVGARPDGDSVWFHPDCAERLQDLPGGRHARLHDLVATTRFTVRLLEEPGMAVMTS